MYMYIYIHISLTIPYVCIYIYIYLSISIHIHGKLLLFRFERLAQRDCLHEQLSLQLMPNTIQHQAHSNTCWKSGPHGLYRQTLGVASHEKEHIMDTIRLRGLQTGCVYKSLESQIAK